MAHSIIEGKSYCVVECLPYHPQGMEACVIADPTSPTGERVAVKHGVDNWGWWRVDDRLGRKVVAKEE